MFRKIQRKILCSYVGFFILCSPIWWYLTDIERISFKVENVFHLNVPIQLNIKNEFLIKKSPFQVHEYMIYPQIEYNSLGINVVVEITEKSLIKVTNDGVEIYAHNHTEAIQNIEKFVDFLFLEFIKFSEFKFSKKYEVAMSLLVQDPKNLVEWSAYEAHRDYLGSFLTKIFDKDWFISSQIKYFENPGYGLFTNPNNPLPYFRNPDWNLVSVSPNTSTAHLVLYVPSESLGKHPVIKSISQNVTEYLSNFYVPGWGSITITKPLMENHLINNAHDVAMICISNLKTLFHVPTFRGKISDIEFEADEDVSKIELLVFKQRQTLKNIMHTQETLTALQKLYLSQTNLPFTKQIIDLISFVQSRLKIALKFNSESWKASKDARWGAEEAFFHPNMVAMLYFPSEHKYAIYLPFFLPVALAIYRTLSMEYALWQHNN